MKARALCDRHYTRLLRHGHTEPTRRSPILEENYLEATASECWPWLGSRNEHGYGRFASTVAHRAVYEKHKGKIPAGLTLDHLCRVRHCVNPYHLEPVPIAENLARGVSPYLVLRDLCRNGLHDITDPASWYVGTYGDRTCLECKRANDRRGDAKRRRDGTRTRSHAQ